MAEEEMPSTSFYTPTRQGKSIESGARRKIMNVYHRLLAENPKDSTNQLVEKVSQLTGVSSRTVYRLRKEEKTTCFMTTPGKVRPRARRKTRMMKYDKSTLSRIRRIIQDFSHRHETPSLDKVMNEINKDKDAFPKDISRSTMYRLLKDLGLTSGKKKRVKIQSTQSIPAGDNNKYERFAASINESSGDDPPHVKQEPMDDDDNDYFLPDGLPSKEQQQQPPKLPTVQQQQQQTFAVVGPSTSAGAGAISLQDFVAGQYAPQQLVITQYGHGALTTPDIVCRQPVTAPSATATSSQLLCLVPKKTPSPSDDPTTKTAEAGEEGDSWEPEHPIDTFFRSMAQTVKKFPASLAAETKLEVCRVVTMMELKILKGEKPEAGLGGDPTVGSSKSDDL